MSDPGSTIALGGFYLPLQTDSGSGVTAGLERRLPVGCLGFVILGWVCLVAKVFVFGRGEGGRESISPW